MERIREHPILQFNKDTLQTVRMKYNLDKPGRMDEAIDILQKWIQQQTHFKKKDISRRYLEYTLISTKGSIERAKEQLDNSFTFRTLMPHFFGDFDMKTDFQELHAVRHCLIPKLTKDNYRVVMIKSFGQKFEMSFIIKCFRVAIMYFEHLKRHEYCDGYIYIFDSSEANLTETIKCFDAVYFRQGLSIVLKGYGARVQGVHLVTPSKVIDIVVSIVKPFLSQKICNRIHVHKSFDTVYEHVPKEILPVEYGGKERSFQEIYEQWVDILSSKDTHELLQDMDSACTDESLRQTDVFNDQYMGLPGTFRSMTVD